MHPLLLLTLAACTPTAPGDQPPWDPDVAHTGASDSDEAPLDPLAEDPDAPRCTAAGDEISCVYSSVVLSTTSILEPRRRVYFQVPEGTPPPDGWPVALLFQGSFMPAVQFWSATRSGAFGRYHQVELVQALLEGGYAVLTPNARAGGATYWDTNILPWSLAWETSPDRAMMQALHEQLLIGRFGPLDPARMGAAGISSGGYMSSRMAMDRPDWFRAVAIQSASWATCGGALCVVGTPASDHPPTLLLHGEEDPIVPFGTMTRYAEALSDAGIEHRVVADADAGHAWLEVSPAEVTAWFDTWLAP